jgi:hypothetical protein
MKRKLWVGFSDGKIHFYQDPDYYHGVLKADLFRTRKEAKRCYQDVRPLPIQRNTVKKERP